VTSRKDLAPYLLDMTWQQRIPFEAFRASYYWHIDRWTPNPAWESSNTNQTPSLTIGKSQHSFWRLLDHKSQSNSLTISD